MRKLPVALVIGVLAWQAWGAYQARHGDEEILDDGEDSVTAQLLDQEAASDEHSPYRARALLADDFLRRGRVLPRQLPGREDGWRWRRRALREAMVR